MARYSPGAPRFNDQKPEVWVDFWRRTVNVGDVDYPATVTDVEFTGNRRGIGSTAGVFNGSTSKVVFDRNTAFEGTEISFGGWFYVNAVTADDRGLVYGPMASSPFSSFIIIPRRAVNGNCRVELNLFGDANQLNLVGNNPVGQWHHIAAVFRDGNFYGYYDGQMVSSTGASGTMREGTNGLGIGCNVNDDLPFDGYISEAFVSSVGYSDAQIESLYNRFPVGRGSSGGSTFQNSGSSFAIRSRQSGLKHRTVSQSLSRNAFHHVQSNIQNLSGAQLAEYTINSPSFPLFNSLNELYYLRNTNLFNSQNLALVRTGAPLVEDSLPPVSPPSLVSITVNSNATGNDFGFTLGIGTVPADWIFACDVSQAFSAGELSSSAFPPFRLAEHNAGESSDFNIYSEWLAKFGNVEGLVGSRIILRLVNIHTISGQVFYRIISNSLVS